MPDWLLLNLDTSQGVAWNVLLTRLIFALVQGGAIAAIYRGTRNPAIVAPTFPATLVLLCVLIAMVTQVIGDNVARAFSLVGALSIVRFRTVVRDTKDTAFVIFAVVVGMASGAGQPMVALCGTLVVGMTALLFRDQPRQLKGFDGDSVLTIRLSWSQAVESRLLEVISKHATDIQPRSVSTVRHGAAMELRYHLRLIGQSSPMELIAELNRLEGIQGIELDAAPRDSN